MKLLNQEINDMETKKLEKELEIEMEKERKQREKEQEVRLKLEKEIWAKIRDLEKQKLNDSENKNGKVSEQLSDLEKMWMDFKEKTKNAGADYLLKVKQVKELERKLGNLQKNPQNNDKVI